LVSYGFFAFLAATAIAFHLHRSIAYRRLVLTVASAVFVASYASSASELLPLAAFVLLGYAAFAWVRRLRSNAALVVAILAVLLSFIVLKRYWFTGMLGILPFPYLTVGLSYILFRMLHVIIDACSGDIPERIAPLQFFRYTCNFLSFLSGPIQRYREFAASDGVEAAPLDDVRVYRAFSRIVTGYFKFVAVAAAADYLLINLKPQLLDLAVLGMLKSCLIYSLCAAAYTAYLYFNFSGYMDIVLGFGLLLGQHLPENFNRPFLARSFLEFWQRWHITLSEWFRDYLFNPLLMALMTRFPQRWLEAYLAVAAFFVTFLVMGLWHGTTLVFLIYGLLMGAGASVTKLWQVACSARFGTRYRTLRQKTAYIYLARGLTFAYFTVALTCLWMPEPPAYLGLAHRLGVGGIGGAFVMLALGFAAAALGLDTLTSWFGRHEAKLRTVAEGFVYRNLSLAARILAVVAIGTLFNEPPEFVYKVF